ncbi:MAG TPA: hypothetical protein VN035_07540 [Microbacterium sp.]|nr:hypothetical protein [Microbacterium sp.]
MEDQTQSTTPDRESWRDRTFKRDLIALIIGTIVLCAIFALFQVEPLVWLAAPAFFVIAAGIVTYQSYWRASRTA